MIDNQQRAHIHDAVDYATSETTSGCPSCSTTSGGIGRLPSLAIKRYHRYKDQDLHGSFGPGVFCNYDIYLNLYQNTVEVWDPQRPFALDLDSAGGGQFTDFKYSTVQGLQLFDSNNLPTADLSSAASAVMTEHNGTTYTFDVFRTDPVGTFDYHGRITRIADRNGNATIITYAFTDRNATDAALSYDRNRLWCIDNVIDAYGMQAKFQYIFNDGQYVVSEIDVPGGRKILYSYGAAGLVGLNAIAYPDGSASSFTTSYDQASGDQTITYDDAGATGTHRRKTAYLTALRKALPAALVDGSPLGGGIAIIQPVNRVNKIVNGSGEVAYESWVEASGSSYITYVYEGGGENGAGTLMRYTTAGGAPGITERATSWDPTQPEHTYTWELVENASGDAFNRVVQLVDILNRKTVLTLNPFTGAHLSEARFNADGTPYATESTTYNSFVEPLQYTDRLGRITTYTYDANGNMLTKTVATGAPEQATWSWTYNAKGQPITSTDANGNVTEYHYDDARGFLTSIVEPADNAGGTRGTRTFTYDTVGRLANSSDEVGRTTTWTYDTRDRVANILYNDGSTELFGYGNGTTAHDANLLTSYTDRDGTIVSITYDDAGRKISSTVQSNPPAVNAWSYLVGTQLPSSETILGKRTDYTYDYRLRPLVTTFHLDGTQTLTTSKKYDSAGRVAIDTGLYGFRTQYAFDTEDRVVRLWREQFPNVTGDVTTGNQPPASRDLTPDSGYTLTDYVYDVEGQLLTTTDPNGILDSYEYDQQGRVTARNRAASKLLNGNGALTAITNPKIKARTEYTYDAQGNVLTVKHPRSFDPADNDAGNFITQYTYTNRNLRATRTEATGRPEACGTQYTYYLDGRIKDTVDPRGKTWTKVWKQCCARLGAIADPVGDATAGIPAGERPTTLLEYDFIGNPTHVTRVKNVNPLPTCCLADPVDADTLNEVTTKYDVRHRPIARTVWLAPLGTVDENNPPIAGDSGVPAANGLTTRWRYDDDLTDGQGIDADYAAQLGGLNFASAGGCVGYAVEVTRPAGDTAVTVYDGLGRVVRTIDGNRNVTNISYAAFTWIPAPGIIYTLVQTTVTDPLNHTVKSQVDGIGRTLFRIDAENNPWRYQYDPNGNLKLLGDPFSVSSTWNYDERNRATLCTDNAGDTTGRSYDAHSNVIATTDGFNHSIFCAFDARDRKVGCVDRLSGVTTYTYDANNNLLTIQDADASAGNTGKKTTYTYDPRNLMASETFPDNGARSYTYDGSNRLVSRLDQHSDATTYTYDFANRLSARNYPDALNDTFTYDADSRMLSAASARYNNTVTRTYDPASRLMSETLSSPGVPPGPFVSTVSYGYDAANRQTSVTYPDSSVVTRTFTARNQLQSVAFNTAPVVSRTYDRKMRMDSQTWANGRGEARTYNVDDLPNQINTNGAATFFQYSWDHNKRKTAESDYAQYNNFQTFGYDNEDRLNSYNRGDKTQNWTLSLVGDWNMFNDNGNLQTRVHDFVHELTSINATPLTYDTKGNLTQNNSTQTYTWDFENRMTGATVPVGATTGIPGTHSYTYDALGAGYRRP